MSGGRVKFLIKNVNPGHTPFLVNLSLPPSQLNLSVFFNKTNLLGLILIEGGQNQ
jgi:hypothetical protein